MSPEQVRGEALDGRSNLFSLGAMFYEMVTERKAFDREDVESLRQSILESTPVAPIHVNPKIHPLLSDLIMKALAKDPAERFQNGREMLDELEKCKESKPAAAKKPEAPKGLGRSRQGESCGTNEVRQWRRSRRLRAKPRRASSVQSPRTFRVAVSSVQAKATPAKPAEKKPAAAGGQRCPTRQCCERQFLKCSPEGGRCRCRGRLASDSSLSSPEVPEIDLSSHTIEAPAEPSIDAVESSSEYMSAAVLDEPEVESRSNRRWKMMVRRSASIL